MNSNGPIPKLAARYLDARAAYDDLSERLAEARESMRRAEEELLSAMNDAGLESMRTEDGVNFSRTRKLRYNCPAENRAALMERLEADGYRELFSVPANTLNALMNEKAAAEPDGMLPQAYAGLVNEYEEFKLSVRGRARRS